MSEQDLKIAGLILAAGGSTRLGRPKQLLQLDGVPLVRRAALAALESGCDRVFVVVGANRRPIMDEIADLDIEIVHHRNWQEGIGSSVRAGIDRISGSTPGYAAVLVMLADQIKIRAEHLDRLIEAFRRHGEIAASEYGNTLGVPALFPRRIFGELQQLTGDTGAKRLLMKHASQTARIACPEASVDLDTAADLQISGAALS